MQPVHRGAPPTGAQWLRAGMARPADGHAKVVVRNGTGPISGITAEPLLVATLDRNAKRNVATLLFRQAGLNNHGLAGARS
jgi:hypothetical protein